MFACCMNRAKNLSVMGLQSRVDEVYGEVVPTQVGAGLGNLINQTVQAHHSECAFLLPFVNGGLLQAASAGRFPFVPVSNLLQPTATALESRTVVFTTKTNGGHHVH
jgi:hypothetical protein